MINFILRTRFPTLLGLGIIILGVGAGVYLVQTNRNVVTKASLSSKPENVLVVNLTDRSATITWNTKDPTTGALRLMISKSNPRTILDDRDVLSAPQIKSYTNHFVSLNNLLPQTTYQYQIISSAVELQDTASFTTSAPIEKSTAAPLIGSVPQLAENPDAVAYLDIPDSPTQAALVTSFGSFTIPLTHISILDSTEASLRVVSPLGEAKATIVLNNSLSPLPPLKIGEDITITAPMTEKAPDPKSRYDLNGDGRINSNDEAILKNNFGLGFQNPKADIDGNGEVEEKDLKLLRSQF